MVILVYVGRPPWDWRRRTNEEFEGTGLGLATVRRIVQRHGGCV